MIPVTNQDLLITSPNNPESVLESFGHEFEPWNQNYELEQLDMLLSTPVLDSQFFDDVAPFPTLPVASKVDCGNKDAVTLLEYLNERECYFDSVPSHYGYTVGETKDSKKENTKTTLINGKHDQKLTNMVHRKLDHKLPGFIHKKLKTLSGIGLYEVPETLIILLLACKYFPDKNAYSKMSLIMKTARTRNSVRRKIEKMLTRHMGSSKRIGGLIKSDEDYSHAMRDVFESYISDCKRKIEKCEINKNDRSFVLKMEQYAREIDIL